MGPLRLFACMHTHGDEKGKRSDATQQDKVRASLCMCMHTHLHPSQDMLTGSDFGELVVSCQLGYLPAYARGEHMLKVCVSV